MGWLFALSMNRSNLRQVLECGSPLPLLDCANVAGNTPRCNGGHPCPSKAAEDCRFWIAPTWPETRQGVMAATRALPKRQRTAALEDARAQPGSWSQCASEVGGRGSL